MAAPLLYADGRADVAEHLERAIEAICADNPPAPVRRPERGVTKRSNRPSLRTPTSLARCKPVDAGRFRARSRPAGRWRQSMWEGRTARRPRVVTDERG